MVCSGENHYIYFIGYKDNDYEIKILGIMLPKASAYVKLYHGETKCMTFLIQDDNLMKKNIMIIKIKSLICQIFKFSKFYVSERQKIPFVTVSILVVRKLLFLHSLEIELCQFYVKSVEKLANLD